MPTLQKTVDEKIKECDFSKFTNQDILSYFNNRCQVCGSRYQVSNHHVIFRSQGGENMPRLPLCKTCHHYIHCHPTFRENHEKRLMRLCLAFYHEVTELKMLDF